MPEADDEPEVVSSWDVPEVDDEADVESDSQEMVPELDGDSSTLLTLFCSLERDVVDGAPRRPDTIRFVSFPPATEESSKSGGFGASGVTAFPVLAGLATDVYGADCTWDRDTPRGASGRTDRALPTSPFSATVERPGSGGFGSSGVAASTVSIDTAASSGACDTDRAGSSGGAGHLSLADLFSSAGWGGRLGVFGGRRRSTRGGLFTACIPIFFLLGPRESEEPCRMRRRVPLSLGGLVASPVAMAAYVGATDRPSVP